MFTNLLSPKILNPRTGIVKEIVQWLPEYDDPRVYVVAALTSNPVFLGIPKIGSVFNSGASITKEGAIWAAIGESLERYGSAIIPNNLILSSYNELEKPAVHPSKFEFYSDKQYETTNFPFQAFLPTTKVAWTKATEILTGDSKYVPAATVYLPYFAQKDKDEASIWMPASTGLACGQNPNQAVLSGLYEIIERDSFMLFWLLGRKAKRIEWHNNVILAQFIEKYFHNSVENIQLLDISSDLKVPTVLCVFHKPGEGLLVSAATRATFVDASKKALTELAQGRITWRRTFETKSKIDEAIPNYSSIRTFDDHVALFTNKKMVNEVPFMFATESVDIDDLQSEIAPNLDEPVKLANHLKEMGYDSYCINLTTEEIGNCNVVVYRSLIPGLLEISNDHVWQRLGNNRIINFYNNMHNKVEFSYTPNNLNPIPHPFP